MIKKTESEALNIIRLVMCVFIVCLHAHTSVQMYPYLGELPVYLGVVRLLSFQIGEMGVPCFFLISGYLFFQNFSFSVSCYWQKMYKRLKTLLVPYLFWNLLIIGALWVVETIPFIESMFNDDGKKLVHDFSFGDFAMAFWDFKNNKPILTQFWYVRDLFLLCAVSPLLYLLLRYTRNWVLFVFAAYWFVTPEVPCTESGILFFSIGSVVAMSGRSLLECLVTHHVQLLLSMLLLISGDYMLAGTAIGFYWHRVLIFIGVFAIIAFIGMLVQRGRLRDLPWLTGASFFIYAAHDPMIRFIRKFSLRLGVTESEWQMVTLYLASVVIDVVVAFVVYSLLRRFAPKFLKFISGGR